MTYPNSGEFQFTPRRLTPSTVCLRVLLGFGRRLFVHTLAVKLDFTWIGWHTLCEVIILQSYLAHIETVGPQRAAYCNLENPQQVNSNMLFSKAGFLATGLVQLQEHYVKNMHRRTLVVSHRCLGVDGFRLRAAFLGRE